MTEIRDAATVIILRGDSILMGQRGATAAFMPNKYVFPGGAVDRGDSDISTTPLDAEVARQLASESTVDPQTLAATAIRELWEETGQCLGQVGAWTDPPSAWRGFAETGHIPHASPLRFFFRAVTPAGRPRRFDARFFLLDAAELASDPDDFSGAEDELSHLHWVPLHDARKLSLPFITQVVLAELGAYLAHPGPIRSIPFFRNDDEAHLVSQLSGGQRA